MKKSVLLTLLCSNLAIAAIFAQQVEWKKNFGGPGTETHNSVTKVSDGMVAVGNTNSSASGDWAGVQIKGGSDAIIVKYDDYGNVVWKKRFGGSGADFFDYVTVVPDGMVAVGYSGSDAFGNGDWAGIQGKGGSDAIIVKYDNSGNVLWKKNFGGSDSDRFYSVTTVSDGVVAAGYSTKSSFGNGDWAGIEGKGFTDAIIVKYDHSGNVIWKKNFGAHNASISGDGFYSVTAVSDGILAVGSALGFENDDWEGVTGKGGYDATIVKFNNSGNVLWKKNFGGSGSDNFFSVTAVSDGILVVGSSPQSSFGNGDWAGIQGKGDYDAIIVKFNNSGTVLWKKSFGGNGLDSFYSITPVSNGALAVGYSRSNSFSNGDWAGVTGKGGEDAIIVKYDNSGDVEWIKNFGGSGADRFNAVTAVSDRIVAAGSSESFNSGDWEGVTGKGGSSDAIMVKFTLQEQFSGGMGTQVNPYIITTAAQLAELATYVNDGNANYNDKFYRLGNDIDLSGYQSGEGWKPIGINEQQAFKGQFDGDNHKVTGLKIDSPVRLYVGLFGYVSAGTILNLGVENAGIHRDYVPSPTYGSGPAYAGGVAGFVKNSSSIYGCYSAGEISAIADNTNAYVGGIVGRIDDNSSVSNCYSIAIVSANATPNDAYAGGVVGYVNSSSISLCYSTGVVTSTHYAGGIAAYLLFHSITDCVALNPSIVRHSGNTTYFERVLGYTEGMDYTLDRNLGFEDMINHEGEVRWHHIGATDLDGANISKEQINADGTLGGRFGVGNVWTLQDGKLPGLFGKPVDMPAHLQPGEPVWGCTDPDALNYNPDATVLSQDFPCEYAYLTLIANDYKVSGDEPLDLMVSPELINIGFAIYTPNLQWKIDITPTAGISIRPDNYSGTGNLENGTIIIQPNTGKIRTFEFSVSLSDNSMKRTVIITQYSENDVWGCMDPDAFNYNPDATVWSPNYPCRYDPAPEAIFGCMDPAALNYDPGANSRSPNYPCIYDEMVWGCTDPYAENYDEGANANDGSCEYAVVEDDANYYGCMDQHAVNWNPMADKDDGSCVYDPETQCAGCNDVKALNYNPNIKLYTPKSCLYAKPAHRFYGIVPKEPDDVVGTFTQENCDLIGAIQDMGVPVYSVTIIKVEPSPDGNTLVSWEIKLENGYTLATTAEYPIPYSFLEGKDIVFYLSIICDLPNLLRSTNPDLSYTFSAVYAVSPGTGIDQPEQGARNWTVYPNPTTGELRITNYELGVDNVEIYDIFGRKASPNLSNGGGAGVILDISHLPAGIYILKGTTADGNVETLRVVKE